MFTFLVSDRNRSNIGNINCESLLSNSFTTLGCFTIMTSSSRWCMYFLTFGSSSVRASIRQMFNVSIRHCILLISAPGVALNPTNLYLAPELFINCTSVVLACDPASCVVSRKVKMEEKGHIFRLVTCGFARQSIHTETSTMNNTRMIHTVSYTQY